MAIQRGHSFHPLDQTNGLNVIPLTKKPQIDQPSAYQF